MAFNAKDCSVEDAEAMADNLEHVTARLGQAKLDLQAAADDYLQYGEGVVNKLAEKYREWGKRLGALKEFEKPAFPWGMKEIYEIAEKASQLSDPVWEKVKELAEVMARKD